ncbi:DnaJ domain-containing protein [Auriculariales sp. MPI-PUGE-AT-0066]|nr:DnaJ domain-containing protein [Auriculariales sp. MPI-PUGE-AT-0066]
MIPATSASIASCASSSSLAAARFRLSCLSLGTARLSLGTARCFSTSSSTADHYKTLGVPRNASRAQIKSSFYSLSKALHPDLNASGGDKGKWLAVTDAYRTLSDDRRRRGYDRESAPASAPGGYRSSSFPQHPVYHTTYDRPKNRAKHAWERSQHSRPSHEDYAHARAHSPYGRMNQHGLPHSSGRPYYGRRDDPTKSTYAPTDQDILNSTNFGWRVVGIGAFTGALALYTFSR